MELCRARERVTSTAYRWAARPAETISYRPAQARRRCHTVAMIKVLLVDDHAIVREGFKRLCEAAPDFCVIAEAADLEQALAAARCFRPEVALVDISLGLHSGLRLIPELRSALPAIKIVILSMHDDPGLVAKALELGADGYVTKGAAADELIPALRRVLAGERMLSSDLGPARIGAAATLRLSEREREILMLLLSGQAPKAVAYDLGLSVKTLYRHRANLMEKLGIRSPAELARVARERGLLQELG